MRQEVVEEEVRKLVPFAVIARRTAAARTARPTHQ